MDKKELLKRIKEENECVEDPYELEVDQKSRAVAGWVMLAFALIVFFWKLLAWEEYAYELIVVATLYFAVIDVLCACKIKTPWRIACAVFWCVLFAVTFAILVYVYIF